MRYPVSKTRRSALTNALMNSSRPRIISGLKSSLSKIASRSLSRCSNKSVALSTQAARHFKILSELIRTYSKTVTDTSFDAKVSKTKII